MLRLSAKIFEKIYRKKRPWKKQILLMGLVFFITAPVWHYVFFRYQIGIDAQNSLCLPPYRIYLIDKYDRTPVRGKPFSFLSEYLQPYGKGIKIVEGLPGDSINVTPTETTVNGKVVGTGLAIAAKTGHTKEELTRSGTLAEGRVWMMGKTFNSFDSRYWGSIPETQIKGRAYAIW